jgi:very-short-patch-repair endonuclease
MQSNNELHPVTMFYGASPLIMKRARELRSRMTETEKILWDVVRENTIQGLKFRRQHPLNNYIADFYCHKIKLVVEIDGLVHFTETAKEYDEYRTNVMNSLGIEVLRFTNEEICNDLSNVINAIESKCSELLASTPSRP